jgi:hypothetical protein
MKLKPKKGLKIEGREGYRKLVMGFGRVKEEEEPKVVLRG